MSYNKFKITLYAYIIQKSSSHIFAYYLLFEFWMFIGRDRQTNEQLERQTDEETVEQSDKQT